MNTTTKIFVQGMLEWWQALSSNPNKKSAMRLVTYAASFILYLFGSDQTFAAGQVCCSPPVGNFKHNITIENVDREFFVHVPPGTPVHAPVLILFHGGGGTAQGIELATHMNEHANSNGFIGVYPQGYDNHWNDGRVVPKRPNQADIVFVDRIIQTLEQQYFIDPRRIYVVGFSDGGWFTERLTFVIGRQIAAAACVCSPETTTLISMYGPGRTPLPILYMLGTTDPRMPFTGGPVSWSSVISAGETVEKCVIANNCDRVPTVTHLPNPCTSDNSYVVRNYYRNPAGDQSNDVVYYKIIGGGHRWPGGDIKDSPNLPPLGNTNQDIDASQVIWDFLSRHQKI